MRCEVEMYSKTMAFICTCVHLLGEFLRQTAVGGRNKLSDSSSRCLMN